MNYDAFSSGQISSKIWLAENLENIIIDLGLDQPRKVLCLGGWYGMINFILKTRNVIKIQKFRNIDIDQTACAIADKLNNFWEWQEWQFKSICEDANGFHYTYDDFDTVINTSVEHFETDDWFRNIPKGTLTVLQSNNMQHDDHCHNHNTLEELVDEFPLSKTLFKGQKHFIYPSWEFYRYMHIGIK